jgi:hypothetical protein
MSILIFLLLCFAVGVSLHYIKVPKPDGWRRRAIKERMRRNGIIR